MKNYLRTQITLYEEDKNYPIWRRQERRSKYAVQLASWQLRSNSPKTSVRPSVCRRCLDDNLNFFHRISFFFGICITWVKILDGIEYEHLTSLNIWYLKRPYGDTLYKSRILLNFNICIFPEFFLNDPGCSVMSAWCPDDNMNCFHWISIFFGLCITWVKILDGIEDGHHTSLNMHIMAGHVT